MVRRHRLRYLAIASTTLLFNDRKVACSRGHHERALRPQVAM
jgi:hypothetical protein